MTCVSRQHSNAAECDSVVKSRLCNNSLQHEEAIGRQIFNNVVIKNVLSIFAISPN